MRSPSYGSSLTADTNGSLLQPSVHSVLFLASLYFRKTARKILLYFQAALSDVLSMHFNQAAALCIHAWLHSFFRQKGNDLTDDRIKYYKLNHRAALPANAIRTVNIADADTQNPII